MSRRARQRRDKRAECHIPDEAALSRLMTNGAEAWRTVPDAAAWVDELRGHTMNEAIKAAQERYESATKACAAELMRHEEAKNALYAERNAACEELNRLRTEADELLPSIEVQFDDRYTRRGRGETWRIVKRTESEIQARPVGSTGVTKFRVNKHSKRWEQYPRPKGWGSTIARLVLEA